MSAVGRPAGLTALAIINAVLGGIYAVTCLLTLLALLETHRGPEPRPAAGESPEVAALSGDPAAPADGGAHPRHAHRLVSHRELTLRAGGQALCAVLLGISCLGYLHLSWLGGRVVGTLYGVVAIALFILDYQVSHQPVQPLHLVALVYPLASVLLVNSVYRRDLVR